MIHSIIQSLPAGVLPHMEISMLVLLGICALVTFFFFFRMSWLAGLFFLTLTTGLWIITPSIMAQVEARQLGHDQTVGNTVATPKDGAVTLPVQQQPASH